MPAKKLSNREVGEQFGLSLLQVSDHAAKLYAAEVAGTLYGVTMEEKGVSKLVSVEMEDVQPEERRTA